MGDITVITLKKGTNVWLTSRDTVFEIISEYDIEFHEKEMESHYLYYIYRFKKPIKYEECIITHYEWYA